MALPGSAGNVFALFVDMVYTRKERRVLLRRQCCQLDGFYCFLPAPPFPTLRHLYAVASRHTLRMRVVFLSSPFLLYLLYVFALIFKHSARFLLLLCAFVCCVALSSIAFHLTVANLFIGIDRHLFVVALGLSSVRRGVGVCV